ncbi:MAG: amidase [Gemmatimonadetes bacterium]|nr:amidase [Gemmatimonadota bacterium]
MAADFERTSALPRDVTRRDFVATAAAAAAAAVTTAATPVSALAAAPRSPAPTTDSPEREDALFEKSVAELGALMARGELTSRALTERYLQRIRSWDQQGPRINAVIELNPDAAAMADALDAERRAGRVRGPLHGIPVLIKDNSDSADKMRTTAGSLALADSTPLRDAFIVTRLREAGAVLLGKTNLSEWANYRSTHSTSGWSGRGGLTHHPYVLSRNTSGSSSGTAAGIASDFATVGIGTETDGSIISPASICGLVGIKPTVGLWSRSGIIPIAASQDTAGPMCRTVADAAALLGVLAGVDARDQATRASVGRVSADYTTFLQADSLRGARIGVARAQAGFHLDVDRAFNDAIAAMQDAGAVIIDPASLPTPSELGSAELTVLDYEFKAGLNAYLAARGAGVAVRTLAELIAWNEREKEREMPWFGQEIFIRAQQSGPLTDKKYLAARATCLRLTRTLGIDAVMAKHRLDAIVLPSNQPAWTTDLLNGDHFTGGDTTYAAVSGYPSITVPMGMVLDVLPVGVSFIGRAWEEGRLISYAFAFEQATKARKSPMYRMTTVPAKYDGRP